ncbi:MAG: hypothetical protein C5B48_11575, partial [Candidatus Rokuibacteriota bacterium]
MACDRDIARDLGRSAVFVFLLAGFLVNPAVAQATSQSVLNPRPLAPTSPGALQSVDLGTGPTHDTPRARALSESAGPVTQPLPGSPGSAPLGAATDPSVAEALGTPAASPPLITAAQPSRVVQTYSFPWATVFKLLVRFTANGQNVYYMCSAASLSSFHLLTAGQCLYNHDILGNGSNVAGWAQEIWAWPAQTDVVGP